MGPLPKVSDRPRFVANVAALSSITGKRDGDQAQTGGYTTLGDGGSNTYYWDDGSSTTADGGFVLTATGGRWKAVDQSEANALHFGCAADDSTDDRAALLAASNTGKQVIVPAGTYRVASNLTIAPHIVFQSGAVLHPDDGVTVTLANGYTASPKQQVFDISSGGYCFASKPSNSTQYHWGAVSDGSTDDTDACQACIDQGLYHDGSHRVEFAGGNHKISTLVIGWGDDNGYMGAHVSGPNNPYDNDESAFGGVRFVTESWENGIEVRSARTVNIERLFLRGPWYTHITDDKLGNSDSTEDPSVEANWIPSGAPAAATTQYAHSAGIHVDPRCGTEPGTAYSDIAIPAYADRGQGQYGHTAGSRVTVADCNIEGFGIAYAIKGCDASTNADYMSIRGSRIQRCLVGMSIGNSQARLNAIKDCVITQVHTAIDTDRIGDQSGKPTILVKGCEIGRSYQIFDVTNGGTQGAVTVRDCYGELLGRFGRCVGGVNTRSALNIIDSTFKIEVDNGYDNMHREHIDATNTTLRIAGCNIDLDDAQAPLLIRGNPRLCSISAVITNADWDISDNVARAMAVGSTCHVMFLSSQQGGWTGEGFYSPAYTPSTGSQASSATGARQNYSPTAPTQYNTIIPFCALEAVPNLSRAPYAAPVRLGYYGADFNTTGKTVSYTGREITIDVGSLSSSVGFRLNAGYAAGCLMYDSSNENLFVITDVTGTEITAIQLNNYALSGGAPVSATDNGGDQIYLFPTGHYMPSLPYRYSWTSASADCDYERADGVAGDAAQIPANCAIAMEARGDVEAPISQSNSTVSSNSSGTITFAGAATATKETSNHVFLQDRS